jgi:PAS domain S-box-containing protein
MTRRKPRKSPGKPSADRSISKRTKAESDREQLNTLTELIENVDAVLWIRDLFEERLLYVSPAFARIWGKSTESLLHSPRTWIDSVHPDDREHVLAAALKNARTGKDRMKYRIVRPDGSIRWIYDRSFPVRNAGGEIYRLVGIAEDITEEGPNA